MPTIAATEVPLDPAAAVGHALAWLWSGALHVAVAVVIATVTAKAMRSRHLHWSWTTLAGAGALLLRSALGGWALTLALSALMAGVRGRRWQREDVQAGGDLAQLAALRKRPLDLAGKLAASLAAHAGERWGLAAPAPGRLRLGTDERGRAVDVPFEAGGGAHTLVVGATGSGKTVTQTWILTRAVERQMGAIVIDPKGDAGLREQVRGAALAAGREFLEWTPEGALIYNPFARGGASEIADKALAGERFTEPHYLRQAQRYLGHVVRALQAAEVEVSLATLVEHLEPALLEDLARALPEGRAGSAFAYLDSLSSRQRSDLAGVRDRLAILAESDVGRWLDPRTPGAERFDLLAAARARAVVYFALQADTRPLLSEMLGAAIVQDLQTVVACLQGRPVPTLVAIDEFSAIAAEQVVRLFARARSAGFSLLLGTQELSDLRPPGRERLLEQVLGNLSVLIAHRQVVPGSAELISNIAGRRGAWRVSAHSDGRSTRVRGQEPVLEPQRVMHLDRGWSAVLVLGQAGGVHVARMFSPARDRAGRARPGARLRALAPQRPWAQASGRRRRG
jgi:conjugal transfer pilus assembly protein TraD